MLLLDQLAGLAYVRDSTQAQEIDLEHPQLIDNLHRPLGNDADGTFSIAFGGPVERHVLHQRAVGDEDARRVSAGVPGHALDFHRRVQQFLDVGDGVVHLLEIGHLLQGLRDGHGLAGHVGDEARRAVHFAEGDVQRAAHVTDGGARAQRPKGDDGGDAVFAVALSSVGDQLLAPVVGVVQVDVGHRNTVGIEKSLEHQAVLERIDVGNA